MPRLFDVSNVKTKTPIYQINASKAWNERNKDFMTEYWKKYADEHKAEISAKKKEYYKRKIEANKDFRNLQANRSAGAEPRTLTVAV